MRNICTLTMILLTILSCNNSDNIDPIGENQLQDWIALEIPEGREAFAIAGEISDTLLVTTWTKAYYSVDSGRTWNESFNFNGHVWGLLERNDTIFAIISVPSTQADSVWKVGICQRFTTDYGRTWESDKTRMCLNLIHTVGLDTSAMGVAYRIRRKYELAEGSTNVYFTNPPNVEKQENGNWQKLNFPLKRQFNNIYIDANDYLYLASSSGTFNENNHYVAADAGTPALIYVSRSAVP